MANLADDDLLLVQRTSAGISTNYSITGSALKEDLGGPDGLIVPPVEVLTPINGAGITEFDQYEPLSSAITTVGEAGTIAKDTDNIQSVTSLATGAANLDRNNASWINVPSGVSIGTSEFTLECFFYVDSFNDYGTIFDSRVNGSQEDNQIFLGTDSQNRVYLWAVDGSGNASYRYEKSLNTGQWYHLALVRDSNNLMHLYIDGTHATKNSGDYNHSGSINSLTRLGQSQLDEFVNYGTFFEWDGKFSNVRVTVGQALYTSNFTASLTPLTTTSQGAIASNVKLLCCQSTTDVTAAAVSPGSLVANGHAVATSGPSGSSILLSFPTNTNFSELSVNQLISDYATFDPDSGNESGGVLSEDKLTLSTGPGQYIERLSDLVAFNNKSYVEYTMSGSSDLMGGVGVGAAGATLYGGAGTCVMYRYNGQVVKYPGNNIIFTVDSWGDGDVISIGLDNTNPNNPTIHFNKNGTNVGSVGLSQFSFTEDLFAFASLWPGTQSSIAANFGESPFVHPPAQGYSGLNPNVTITSIDASATPPTITVDGGTWTTSDSLTSQVSYEKSLTFTDTTELANMVAPIEMADATGSNSLTPTTSNVVSTSFTPSASYFNVTTYTGNASTSVQTFNTGLDIQNNGGMIWFKSRTSGQAARIIDTYRGTRPSLLPHSDSLNSALGADGLTFLDDGFSIGWEGNDIASANDYVAWSFREAAEFFDIVTWTGNGSSTRTISHNLGSRPGFIIVKKTAGGSNRDWWCWHKSISTGDLSSNPLLRLNATNGITNPPSNSPLIGTASSTMFEIAGDDNVNGNGNTYIAYVFADNPSKQIKCSSYLGNATGGGSPAVPNQIECGFRPKFVLIKNAGNDTDWHMFDDERGDRWIEANSSDPEGFSDDPPVVFNDTGFSLPTGYHHVNQDNTEHIFMAIGEAGNPDTTELTFQDNTALSALTSGMTITSNGGPLSVPTFNTTLWDGNDQNRTITTGLDMSGEGGMVWLKRRDAGTSHLIYDTERGAPYHIEADWTSAQSQFSGFLTGFVDDGFTIGTGHNINSTGSEHVAWSFRKAAGFFDIVKWNAADLTTGNLVNHNLGTTPGMILCKNLNNGSAPWYVYHKDVTSSSSSDPNAHFLYLNESGEAIYSSGMSDPSQGWGVTDTQFRATGSLGLDNGSDNFIAYVFADNPSNSIKCGGYSATGTNNTQSINFGFRPGWLIVKMTSNNENYLSSWIMVDSERGTTKQLPADNAQAEFDQSGIVFTDTGIDVTGWSNRDGWEYVYLAIGSPTALSSIPTGTLTDDADPSTNTVNVAASSWPTGDTVTGPSLSASLTSILEVSGNTIFGNGSDGAWIPGYYAEGSQINDAPPGPSEITFTSQNQGTPTFSGVDATLASRTWTLESGASATGPWTVVDTYVDYDVLNSQDGATPWSSNKPTLQPNTYYRIKVQYNSTNAESVESVYHTFRTGDA